MLGRKSSAAALAQAALIAGIGMAAAGQPGLEKLVDSGRLGYYGRKHRFSGGNGKPHCAAHAKRKRKLRNQAISQQRRLTRERS